MRRAVAVLLGLVLAFGGLVGRAEGSAAAACVISGTINFSPPDPYSAQGTWRIEPAIISCEGIFRAYERITGPGSFKGSGTYTEIAGKGGCLHQVGSGHVDYRFQTTETDVHITEPHRFVLAGAGVFTTPSLNGKFQIAPPYDGDCVSRPVARAGFIAEGSLVRINGVSR